MPRLVHLAPASRARAIERAGIRGGRALVREAKQRTDVERGVYAMPLMQDFSMTHQWLRELRRGHDERMIAVHFKLPGDEEVLVGRYNMDHERVPLREAVRRITKEPLGNELVVLRSIRRRELTRIREMTQLVGWTEIPEQEEKAWDCLCQVCVPAGTKDLMRRVRGEFERHLLAARKASSNEEIVEALRRLSMPLERANGRIEPDKLLVFAKAAEHEVRRHAAGLFGNFRFRQVESVLARLLQDPDVRARQSAVESLVRAGGLRRARAHIVRADNDMVAYFDEQFADDEP